MSYVYLAFAATFIVGVVIGFYGGYSAAKNKKDKLPRNMPNEIKNVFRNND